MTKVFPHAHITGIDITPRIGRMFRGNLSKVSFRRETIKDFASVNPEKFDLVLIIDVLHHIPPALHKEFLIDARKSIKRGGLFLETE